MGIDKFNSKINYFIPGPSKELIKGKCRNYTAGT